MRTELVSRLAETARASALNSYRKTPSAPLKDEKKGDTVELSAEAKKMNSTGSVEKELEKAVLEKVRNLKNTFSSGNLSVSNTMLDQIADRIIALI